MQIRVSKVNKTEFCNIEGCREDSIIEIRFLMTYNNEGYIKLCGTHIQDLRYRINPLSILVQTGINTKE